MKMKFEKVIDTWVDVNASTVRGFTMLLTSEVGEYPNYNLVLAIFIRKERVSGGHRVGDTGTQNASAVFFERRENAIRAGIERMDRWFGPSRPGQLEVDCEVD